MHCNVQEITYNNLYNDVIKQHLLGKVFHITPTKNYFSIVSDDCIYASNVNLPQNYPQTNISFGLKNNCVCLLDYRNIEQNTNKELFQISITMFFDDCYIFVLDESFYANLITLTTDCRDYHIPKFECWYKNKIMLDNISEIYHIIYQRTAEEEYKYRHSIIGMAIEYEKEKGNG